jgi:hypothetical protein
MRAARADLELRPQVKHGSQHAKHDGRQAKYDNASAGQ